MEFVDQRFVGLPALGQLRVRLGPKYLRREIEERVLAQHLDLELVQLGGSYFSSGVMPPPPYTVRPLSVIFTSVMFFCSRWL